MDKVCESGSLRKELERCAYYVISRISLADDGKPDFVQTNQGPRAGFKEYAIANETDICEYLKTVKDPVKNLCMIYGVVETVGDDFSTYGYNSIMQIMLRSYLSVLTDSSTRRFVRDFMAMMLPKILPYAIKIATTKSQGFDGAEYVYGILRNVNVFNGITRAEFLLNDMGPIYENLKVPALDSYLRLVYQHVYFLYVVLHQDCKGLEVRHIEKITMMVKAKAEDIDDKSLLPEKMLNSIDHCVAMLLELENNLPPTVTSVYEKTKSLLFSLVLDLFKMDLIKGQKEIFAPALYKINEVAYGKYKLSAPQRVDLCVALLSLDDFNIVEGAKKMCHFTVPELIELVHAIYEKVLVIKGPFDCLVYLSYLLQQSVLAKPSSKKGRNEFFSGTKQDFEHIFTDASLRLAIGLYTDSSNKGECLSVQGEKDLIKSKVTHFHSLFAIITAYEAYKKAYPAVVEMLPAILMVHLEFMEKHKLWGNTVAYFLFGEVQKELLKIKDNAFDFMLIKRKCNILILKLSAGGVSATDLGIWEKIFKVFPTINESIARFKREQRREISDLFLIALNKMQFDVENPHAIFEVKICSIILSIATIKAKLMFYRSIDKSLTVLNNHYQDLSSELVYQLSLIKNWLIDDNDTPDKEINGRALKQIKILAQQNTSVVHRARYLCQIAEVLYLITKRPGYFEHTAVHDKIVEVSNFILAERNSLYNEILGMRSIQFDTTTQALLCYGQKFLDIKFMALLQQKMPGIEFDIPDTKGLRKSLDITGISFAAEKMVVHCKDQQFILAAKIIPKLNILRSYVRNIDNREYYLFTDEGTFELIAMVYAQAVTDNTKSLSNKNIEVIKPPNSSKSRKKSKKRAKKQSLSASNAANEDASSALKSAKGDGAMIKELRSCACSVFASKDIPVDIKPIFLQGKQGVRADFSSYISENERDVLSAAESIEDPIEHLCIAYSLLEFGDDCLSENFIHTLKRQMLPSYLGMLNALDILGENQVNAPVEFSKVCQQLMAPLLQEVLPQSVCGEGFARLKSSDMLEAFCDNCKDLAFKDLDQYMIWLHQSFSVLHSLLSTNDSLDNEGVVKFINSVKMKLLGLDAIDLKASGNLDKLQLCLGKLLEIDRSDLGVNAGVYIDNKVALFSVLLDIMLPVPNPHDLSEEEKEILVGCFDSINKLAFGNRSFPEQTRLDIYVALFTLEGVDVDKVAEHLSTFTMPSFIEMVARVQALLSLDLGYNACVKHLGTIVRYGILENKSCTTEDRREFYTTTKKTFENVFKGALARILSLFYVHPEQCFAQGKAEETNGLLVSNVLKEHKFHLLMVIYREYKSAFAEAKSLLAEFHIVGLNIMDAVGAWGNERACLLLQGVLSGLEYSGIARTELDFITISSACEKLIKAAQINKISLNTNDLVFWEKVFDVFSSLKESSEEWSDVQRARIDGLLLTIINKLLLDSSNKQAILEVRFCAIVISLLRKEPRNNIYARMEQLLKVINDQHQDAFADSAYQLVLVRYWLCEHVEKKYKYNNSAVLGQLQVFLRRDMDIINKIIYLCQLAEVLHLITQQVSYFAKKEDLYGMIAETASAIIEERNFLYRRLTDIKKIDGRDVSAIIFDKGKQFIDYAFMNLLLKKMPLVGLDIKQARPHKQKILDITDLSFTENSLLFHCGEKNFSVVFDNMPPLNILKAQVRYYKSEDRYKLFSGDDEASLTQLTVEANYAQSNAAEQLSEEQLLSLWDESSSAANKPKKSKKKAKKKKGKNVAIGMDITEAQLSSDVSLADTGSTTEESYTISSCGSDSSKDHLYGSPGSDTSMSSQNVEELDNLSPELVPSEVVAEVESFASAADFLGNADVIDSSKVEKLIQDYMGINIIAEVIEDRVKVKLADSIMLFSVGKDFAGVEKLQQSIRSIVEMALKAAGADSFARVVYNPDGKATGLESVIPGLALPVIGVKKGNILKSVGRLQKHLLDEMAKKLGVSIELNSNGLCISDSCAQELCGLDVVKRDGFLQAVKGLRMRLFASKYGGMMAFAKLIVDTELNVVAIGCNSELASNSLQEVAVTEGDVEGALELFFKSFDSTASKFFSALEPDYVVFMVKVMQILDMDLTVYGHPVIEYDYSDALRSSGVARQAVSRLFIGVDALEQQTLIDTLVSSGAWILGVKPHAIYCKYNGHMITVSLNHNYMLSSMYKGDHFYGTLARDPFSFGVSGNNPATLAPAVIQSGVVDDFALKVALGWHRVMGKLGGSLRDILDNLRFMGFLISPPLEQIVWQRASGSVELLPNAAYYVSSMYHVSEEEAKEVVAEAESMLKGRTSF